MFKLIFLISEIQFTQTFCAQRTCGNNETLLLHFQDEKLIRDKLVSKLKEKEKQKVEHFGERIKNAKETNQLSSDDEDSLEEISEDDVRKKTDFDN